MTQQTNLHKAIVAVRASLFLLLALQSETRAQSAMPVAYWTFDDDTARDMVGTNHGTAVGVTFTTGKVGRALNFSGACCGNQYVKIPSFNLPNITVELWFNPGKYGYYTSMVTKPWYASGWSDPWTTWILWLSHNTANPEFMLQGQGYGVRSLDPIPMNQWVHLAGTYDGETMKLYVNGVEKASDTAPSGPITARDGNIYIGVPEFSNHSFLGQIDEVAIWDHAITVSEIQQHYNNGLNGLGYLSTPPVITVGIDIKPGSFPNAINPKSKGVIPVAILSTNSFDATTVDPLSVKFGSNGATEIHNKGHIQDVDGDGDLDLVLHFATQATGIKQGDVSASLTGKTFGGQDIQGSDAIVTVSGNSKIANLNPEVLGSETSPSSPIEAVSVRNYPNPFNPSTIIGYTLQKDEQVIIKVYNSLGEEVAVLVNEVRPAGVHNATFNAAGLPSGVYFYRLQAGSFVDTRKLILLK